MSCMIRQKTIQSENLPKKKFWKGGRDIHMAVSIPSWEKNGEQRIDYIPTSWNFSEVSVLFRKKLEAVNQHSEGGIWETHQENDQSL